MRAPALHQQAGSAPIFVAAWCRFSMLPSSQTRPTYPCAHPPLPLPLCARLGCLQRALREFPTLRFYATSPMLRDEVAKHAELITRFGRFPHRNAVLGRASTPEEEAYLASQAGGHSYGQAPKAAAAAAAASSTATVAAAAAGPATVP